MKTVTTVTTTTTTRKYNVTVVPIKIKVENTNINTITLPQEYGNSVFIGKITGNKIQYLNGIVVTDLRKISVIDMVQHLLFALVAEYKARKEFECKYSKFELTNKVKEDSNVKAMNLFKSYLSTSTIYRVNGNGDIVCGVKLTGNLTLRDTALKINDKHLLATCKKENLKAVLYQHAKAIAAQFQYIDNIKIMIKELITTTSTEKSSKDKVKASTTIATLQAVPQPATA